MSHDFSNITSEVIRLVYLWKSKLEALPQEVITQRRNNQNRNIIQILGHLVDSASNNHQRMVRLQYITALEFPDYRQDNDTWIRIQNYEAYEWNVLIEFWQLYNKHIVYIIKNIDETKLQNSWHDFEGTKVTLEQMINGYLDHLNLHLDEILELMDQN